jgi:SH3 domain protein
MHNLRAQQILFGIFFLLSSILSAETVYVIDELKIGLHSSPTIDSPIIKLVSSGSSLYVIERDNDLIHVQETGGTKGWINNKYVVVKKPGKSRINELEENNKTLKQVIDQLKTRTMTTSTNQPEVQKKLEQQLNSERLKAGALQAQLAALKANVADFDDSDKFLSDIETLQQKNRQLIALLESSDIKVNLIEGSSTKGSFSINKMKQMPFTLFIVFLFGIGGGVFILDLYNRRRHGGFRI